MTPNLWPQSHPPLHTALVAFRTTLLDICMRADTSASTAEWSPQNPARGQSAVVACAVQDAFGGNIVNCTATTPDGKTESHYFNEIDGHLVDVTRDQFPDGALFSAHAPKAREFNTTRDYVLSNKHTAARYDTLRTRIGYEKMILNTLKFRDMTHG
jgi:hypothetical protein